MFNISNMLFIWTAQRLLYTIEVRLQINIKNLTSINQISPGSSRDSSALSSLIEKSTPHTSRTLPYRNSNSNIFPWAWSITSQTQIFRGGSVVEWSVPLTEHVVIKHLPLCFINCLLTQTHTDTEMIEADR